MVEMDKCIINNSNPIMLINHIIIISKIIIIIAKANPFTIIIITIKNNLFNLDSINLIKILIMDNINNNIIIKIEQEYLFIYIFFNFLSHIYFNNGLYI